MTLQIEVKDAFADEIINILKALKDEIISIKIYNEKTKQFEEISI